MKAVLMSIQPKWCELIAKGEKEIDLRKTAPALKTPFKCYIYMSQGKLKDLGTYSDWFYQNRMKVIGEFVCDRIEEYHGGILEASYIWRKYHKLDLNEEFYKGTCVSYEEMHDYLEKGKYSEDCKNGYGWHISDLKIYDTPKELREFRNLQGQIIKRPFQSWGYVCTNE